MYSRAWYEVSRNNVATFSIYPRDLKRFKKAISKEKDIDLEFKAQNKNYFTRLEFELVEAPWELSDEDIVRGKASGVIWLSVRLRKWER